MWRVVLILCVAIPHQQLTKSENSAELEYRIEVLKRKILQEIKQPEEFSEENPVSDLENYEYVDMSNRPITPIMDFDPRKLKNHYIQPEFKTTKSRYVPPLSSEEEEKPSLITKKPKPKTKMMSNTKPKPKAKPKSKPKPKSRSKPKHKSKPKRKHKLRNAPVTKAKEIFYRKSFFNTEAQKDTENTWIHCVDLFTPYMYGYMNKIKIKYYHTGTQTVKRVIHLLTRNASWYDADEIRAIMYQLSNLKIHFFNWHKSSITDLLNNITKSKVHTFQDLKQGMKAIFQEWSLDISNQKALLKQMRIFRPPCMPVTKTEGSTLTSRGVTFTKPKLKKNLCLPKSADDSECEEN